MFIYLCFSLSSLLLLCAFASSSSSSLLLLSRYIFNFVVVVVVFSYLISLLLFCRPTAGDVLMEKPVLIFVVWVDSLRNSILAWQTYPEFGRKTNKQTNRLIKYICFSISLLIPIVAFGWKTFNILKNKDFRERENKNAFDGLWPGEWGHRMFILVEEKA